MKRFILSIIVVTVCMVCTNAYCQDISKLTLPASPAFSILGYEPSSVMRPTNVKSLATDVLNSFDKEGKLLVNLGLEAAPYWLGSHPNLTMDTYLNPNVGQTILQSLSLSAATIKDSSTGQNKLGFGFRFKVYNGEPVKDAANFIAAKKNLRDASTISSIVAGVASTFNYSETNTKQKVIDKIEAALVKAKISKIIVDEFKKQANQEMKSFSSDSEDDVTDFLKGITDNWVNGPEFKELQAKVNNLLYQREGFVIEFAGASGFNTSKNNSLEKAGFWGNASYYVSPDDLFTFTARYMFKSHDTTTSNFDAGLSFLKKTDKYNVAVEAMYRYYSAEIPDINIDNMPIIRLEKKSTYRFAVQGAYNISEVLSINMSFGKDFDSPFISKSAFFSILGLNYSIFSKSVPQLK